MATVTPILNKSNNQINAIIECDSSMSVASNTSYLVAAGIAFEVSGLKVFAFNVKLLPNGNGYGIYKRD